MKKLLLSILLTLCLLSSGCSPPAPEPEPESSSAVSETSSQEEEPVSSQREYLPENDDYSSVFDFETIIALCFDALTEFQSALVNETEMDFSKYIENPDLIAYMEKQLEVGIDFQGVYPFKEFERLGLVEYDLWRLHDKQAPIYLRVGYEDRGSVEFLVENTGERFVIVEWYNGNKDSMDTLCRGFFDIRKDDLYWDNYDPEALQKAIEERKKGLFYYLNNSKD